jgi:Coenzyme PQQ synthesis protein D (PqqD)
MRTLPKARESQLIVEAMAEETLVYDLRRHKAHYLNPTAALVWRCCHERKSLAETVALLDSGLPAAEAETIVWMALDRLERAHLLTESPSFPRPRSRYPRRQVIRTLGLGAAATLLLPLVDSIVSPVAAQAGSCVTAAQCTSMFFLLCNGQPICGSRRDCCQRRGFRCRVRKC